MSSVALTRPIARRTAVNPWVVAAIVVVPTFMEILDTTIANVALRYISGGLSAAQSDSEWVITSYLAANAIVLPITGWLSARLGRRNYFLICIAVFTLASALCGFATSLTQMILFRIIQGLAGGGLQPCSQGVLLDAFPEEKQGTAMTLFGVAAILGPIVGPTLGGWLCVNYDWRWIFLINVPIGVLSLIAAYRRGRGSRVPQARAGRTQPPAAQLRLHRPERAGPGYGCVGNHAQQGTGMGLAGRSVRPGADARRPVRARTGIADLPRNADGEPDHQFPRSPRPQPFPVLHHHVLCLWRGLLLVHRVAVTAPVTVRLRRASLGTDDVALGRFLDGRDDPRRRAA